VNIFLISLIYRPRIYRSNSLCKSTKSKHKRIRGELNCLQHLLAWFVLKLYLIHFRSVHVVCSRVIHESNNVDYNIVNNISNNNSRIMNKIYLFYQYIYSLNS
jgi:hypothetical protein